MPSNPLPTPLPSRHPPLKTLYLRSARYPRGRERAETATPIIDKLDRKRAHIRVTHQ